jgi:hypothetical protein
MSKRKVNLWTTRGLTIMYDSNRRARGEGREGVLVAALSSYFGNVLDLGTNEGWGSTRLLVNDAEGVGGQLVQERAGVVEERDGLVAGVGESCGDLEVLDTIDGISTYKPRIRNCYWDHQSSTIVPETVSLRLGAAAAESAAATTARRAVRENMAKETFEGVGRVESDLLQKRRGPSLPIYTSRSGRLSRSPPHNRTLRPS